MGMTAAPPRRVAVILFALVVLGTGAAFFVTQRLKRSTPIIGRVYFHQWISPNGDGRKDTVRLRFDLPRAQPVTVWIVNAAGDVVRTLVDGKFLHRGRHSFVWNGRDDHARVAPDGVYRLRVGLPDEGRSVTSPRELYLETRPPRPRILAVEPSTIEPGSGGPLGQAEIRFKGPTLSRPMFAVWRTDGPKVVQVAEFEGRRGRQTGIWDGLVGGKPAPEGTYAISVTVQDKAGNRGSAPAILPPTRTYAAPHSGVSVEYLTLTGSLVPVKPGDIARFTVGPLPRPVRWRLAEIGRRGALSSGVSHGSRLAIRIPPRARRAIYSVLIEAGGRRAAWPVVVGGTGRAAGLVVVPASTWQGQNPVDSNHDGFPDTLDAGNPVPLERPFAHGRYPDSIQSQTVPLLRYLDHIRANFDVTTDVDLMRASASPSALFAGYRGILFAGSQRWLTHGLAVAVRRFAARGGKVASFGVDALRRRVSYFPGILRDPKPPAGANVLGERTSVFTSPPAPLAVMLNKIDLFPGSNGLIGSFTRFERSDRLGSSTDLHASAGRDQKPDLVAYRLGRGLVIRTGTDQWAGQIATSPEVAATTRRIWALISH